MNKIKQLALLAAVFLTAQAGAQVRLINNGATIKVNAAVDLRVNDGSITNTNSAAINNDGNVYLDGDFDQTTSATYTGGTGSWLWFEGTGNQNLTGDATVNITQLKVDNASKLILATSVNITENVDLNSNGNIELGTNLLSLDPGANILNYNANNYIITNSTGSLRQEVSGTNVVFPVGNTIYNPATLNNSGTTDNFDVRVEDQVLDAYPAGNVETDGMVDKAWIIEEVVAGGSNITMTLQWETADELPNFDRTQSGISHWTGTDWDRSPTWTNAPNVGGTSWTQTRTGITSFSPFAVEDISMDLPVELLEFNAKRQNVAEVLLSWATATEINNDGFFLQRMLDGETEFTTLGFVDGQGNSTLTNYYDYVDENSFDGLSYYRLKQVDFDGTESYSPIRVVEGIPRNGFVNVYPNPTNDFINVRFSAVHGKTARIKIYAIDGKLLFDLEKEITTDQVVQLNETQEFPASTYLLQIIFEDGATQHYKFIKQKD